MIGLAAVVLRLSRLADLDVARILLFGAATIAIAVVASIATVRVGAARAPLRSTRPDAGVVGAGGLARLRRRVAEARYSDWERTELVGRLRVVQRALSRLAVPTAESIAEDERSLAALLEAPVSTRFSGGGASEPAESVLVLVTRWEARLHSRPTGGS